MAPVLNNSDSLAVQNSGTGNTTAVVVELRVAVGTANPAKLKAVEQALRHATSRANGCATTTVEWTIQGYNVASGVSDQPMGDPETRRGAQQRAKEAYRSYRSEHKKSPHLAVGLEGGLERGMGQEQKKTKGQAYISDDRNNSTNNCDKTDNNLYCMAWMAVYGRREAMTVDALASAMVECYVGDKKPVFGMSKTAMFPIPTEVAALVETGIELGDADDKIFGRTNSKHGSGLIGLLTDDLIDRSLYYEHAILMALIPWIHPQLYPNGT